MARRALTMLNTQGDVTITWDEDDDDRMEALIAKKMAEGVTFFIIEPRLGGGAPKKTRLASAADAHEHRALQVKDADLATFVGGAPADGDKPAIAPAATADVIKTPDKPVTTRRRAKTAKEAASSESVGVQPMRGG